MDYILQCQDFSHHGPLIQVAKLFLELVPSHQIRAMMTIYCTRLLLKNDDTPGIESMILAHEEYTVGLIDLEQRRERLRSINPPNVVIFSNKTMGLLSKLSIVVSPHYQQKETKAKYALQLMHKCFSFENRRRLTTLYVPIKEWSSRWETSTAIDLAKTINETRAYDRFPILADALEDADCNIDWLLKLLRDNNIPKGNGMWFFEKLLRRQL